MVVEKNKSSKENVQKISSVQNGKVDPVQQKSEVSEVLKMETQKMIAEMRPTAEQRIQNAEKFKIFTSKYDHLKAKKEELEKFKISSDGTKERIYFENSEGYKLEVSNSNIVNDMLKLAETTLTSILEATQKEVQEFII